MIRFPAFKTLLLCGALLLCTQHGEALEMPVAGIQTIRQTESFQVAVEFGQLDVGDERPVGEDGLMRGKKNDHVRRFPDRSGRKWFDLGIALTSLALLGLIIYVFRLNRKYAGRRYR